MSRAANNLRRCITEHKKLILRHELASFFQNPVEPSQGLASSENSMVPACFQSVEVLGWSAAGTEATR